MSSSRADIRQQVLAQIISVMAEAEAAGQDAYDVARRTFPGTPRSVLFEAQVEVRVASEEAWWRQIERTIDGEVIRAAIAGPTQEPIPAGSRDADLDEAFEALFAVHGGAA